MTSKYRLSPQATEDIFQLHAYGARTFGITQADTYLSELLDAFDSIEKFPEIGRDISILRAGYRRHEFKRHSIFYKIEDNRVVIIRVLDNRRDADRHL